jgi:hypothetical protein
MNQFFTGLKSRKDICITLARVKTGYQRFPKEIGHAVTRAGPQCDPKQHLGRFVARSSLFLTRSGAAITSSPIKRYSLPG